MISNSNSANIMSDGGAIAADAGADAVSPVSGQFSPPFSLAAASTAAAAEQLLSAATGGGVAVAAQTASLGDRDMMTFMPSGGNSAEVGGDYSSAGAQGGARDGNGPQQQQQQAEAGEGAAAQAQAQAQAQRPQHHELSPTADAELTAMSVDLMDIFGDGSNGGVGGLMSTLDQAAIQPPALAGNAAAEAAAASAGATTANAAAGGGLGVNVSDSSCSGRSSSSGGNGQQQRTQGTAAAAAATAMQQQQEQQQQDSSWNLALGCGELARRLYGGQQQQPQPLLQQQPQREGQVQASANHPGQLGPAAAQAAHIDPLLTFSAQYAAQPQQVGSSAASSFQQHLVAGGGMPSGMAAPAIMASTVGVPPPPLSSFPHPPMAGTKRPRSSMPGLLGRSAVSEDESDKKKRRRDRNAREQQRSQQIATQITQLRELLTEANVQFKPDKYSTLVGVAEYIRSLQSRKALLDAEHARLLDTIRKTSDVLEAETASSGGGTAPPSPSHSLMASSVGSGGSSIGGGGGGNAAIIPNTVGPPTSASSCAGTSTRSTGNPDEDIMVFVRGLDYKHIFSSCGIALGIAAVDGRLVDCNDEFVELSGRTRGDLVGGPDGAGHKMSLFNLLGREGMEDVFRAMSHMLRSAPPLSGSGRRGGGGSSSDSSPTESSNSSSSTPHLHHHQGMHSHHVSGTGNGAGQIIYQREGSGPSDHWSGIVVQGGSKGRRLRLNITLVRSTDGRPKFFNCALSPHEDG